MPDEKKKIQDLAGKRSQLVDELINRLEVSVINAQRDLLQTVVENFLDGMEIDGEGNIKNTLANQRRLSMFDKVFTRFANTNGLEIVNGISDGISQLVDFNEKYFSVFAAGPVQLGAIQNVVIETLGAWLGISPRGSIVPNGYLDTLLTNSTVKNSIRDIVMKSVISQAGYFDTKKELKNFIQGNKEKTGALQRYYRNFAFDVFSVADRTASKISADRLKLNYAIYEGGLVKDSREFCKERNGKVFSSEEIAAFDPPTAKPPGYDPFTNLGGYACRHHLNFIPDVVAFALRPELKPAAPTKTAGK